MKLFFKIAILTVLPLTGNAQLSEANNISTLEQNTTRDTLIKDGSFIYKVAFAEWNGASMGEEVRVEIKSGYVKVIYEGKGSLTLVKAGDVLDEGYILKHNSGKYIISKNKEDISIEEFGGCTGGPSEIDLVKKLFWLC